eukprot:6205051-Pleurochrysis_carterae.AAC.1
MGQEQACRWSEKRKSNQNRVVCRFHLSVRLCTSEAKRLSNRLPIFTPRACLGPFQQRHAARGPVRRGWLPSSLVRMAAKILRTLCRTMIKNAWQTSETLLEHDLSKLVNDGETASHFSSRFQAPHMLMIKLKSQPR